MRIGLLVENMTVTAGGPSRVAGIVANGLSKRGHDVTVGTMPCDGELVALDASVRLMSVAGRVSNPRSWLQAVGGIRKLAGQVDVLFVSGVWGPVDGLALRLADIRAIPVHIRICGMLEDYILRRHPSRKWVGRTLYTDHNLTNAASLIVNTPIEAATVARLGFPTNIRVIPNGVQLPSEGSGPLREDAARILGVSLEASDKVLLYLSRIHPKKGLHLLLDTIETVLPAHPDWHLVVAGSFFEGEGYEDLIRTKVAASPVRSRIHFVGEVSGPRKLAALSLADLFALPSSSEGFSNAVLEAMAWSVPVLITTGCNFPEVAREDAGWVIDGATQLAEALSEAVADPARLKDRGRKARALIERDYQESHVLDLYERCAAEPYQPRGERHLSGGGVSAQASLPIKAKRRKKVVFFVESLAVATGGTAHEVSTIASLLARRDEHDIHVLSCPDSRVGFPLDPAVRQRTIRGGLSPLGYIRALRDMAESFRGADVVFTTGIWGGFDGSGIGLVLPDNAHLYVRICGMLQPYILNRNKWKKIPARMLYVNHNLNRAEGLIVNSLPERDQVASLGFRSPIHLIRNGIESPAATMTRDEARRRLGLGESARVMLYLGRIHPKKNLDLLVGALANFAAANPETAPPTLLVGGGSFSAEYDAAVARQVQRLPDPSLVRLLGEVRGEDKEAALAAADVFVLPSASEGLPNAALESMVRGMPVILTPGCNLPEVSSSGAGLLVEPDERGLRSAIEWVVGPEEALIKAGENARDCVRREFSVERWVESYLKLIE